MVWFGLDRLAGWLVSGCLALDCCMHGMSVCTSRRDELGLGVAVIVLDKSRLWFHLGVVFLFT